MNIPEIQYTQNENGTWTAALLADDMTAKTHTDKTAYKAIIGLVKPIVSKAISVSGKTEKTSHSSKGKFWIKNDETKEVVLVSKEQLPTYMNKGFVPGRKFPSENTSPQDEQKAA